MGQNSDSFCLFNLAVQFGVENLRCAYLQVAMPWCSVEITGPPTSNQNPK